MTFVGMALITIVIVVGTSKILNIIRFKLGLYKMVLGYVEDKRLLEDIDKDTRNISYRRFVKFEDIEIEVSSKEYIAIDIRKAYILLVYRNEIIGFMDAEGLPGYIELMDEVKRRDKENEDYIHEQEQLEKQRQHRKEIDAKLVDIEKVDIGDFSKEEIKEELLKECYRPGKIALIIGIISILFSYNTY